MWMPSLCFCRLALHAYEHTPALVACGWVGVTELKAVVMCDTCHVLGWQHAAHSWSLQAHSLCKCSFFDLGSVVVSLLLVCCQLQPHALCFTGLSRLMESFFADSLTDRMNLNAPLLVLF